MLEVGSKFPDFSLQDQHGNVVTLADLTGHKTAIYFYPKADTPGCTLEAKEFCSLLSKFDDVRVIGISPDPPKAQLKFDQKYGLGHTLLADIGAKLAQECGIWVEKTLYGKKYMGVERTSYLLDENGIVLSVWRKVNPEGHAAEVLHAASK